MPRVHRSRCDGRESSTYLLCKFLLNNHLLSAKYSLNPYNSAHGSNAVTSKPMQTDGDALAPGLSRIGLQKPCRPMFGRYRLADIRPLAQQAQRLAEAVEPRATPPRGA